MNQKYFIGVDISKSKVDYAVVDQGLELLFQSEVINQDFKLENLLKKAC